jgi:hypothetical protein
MRSASAFPLRYNPPIYESSVRARRKPVRKAVAPNLALAHGFQEVDVLDFWAYIAGVDSDRSVHDSPTSQDSTYTQPAHRTNFRGSHGCHFGCRGVDYLERKVIGKRLGHCRKSYVYSDFPPTIHHPRTTHLGPSFARLVYWSTWTGFFRLARQACQFFAFWERRFLINALIEPKSTCPVRLIGTWCQIHRNSKACFPWQRFFLYARSNGFQQRIEPIKGKTRQGGTR